MKRAISCLAMLVAGASSWADSSVNVQPVAPLSQQAEAFRYSSMMMARHAVTSIPANKLGADAILDRYLAALDPGKVLFTQQEIAQIKAGANKFDPANGQFDLKPAFMAFALYRMRLQEQLTYLHSLLADTSDMAVGHTLPAVGAKPVWPASLDEMHKGWRRKLSDDRRMHARPGADSKITSAQLKERYQRNFNRSALAKSEEVFETFMNAYLHALDPHAVFMAPAQEESASTSELKSSMVGIGLVLKIHNGFATLREIVPDGPAARSGQLSLGDRIVAIAQDSGGAMVNVIGWPLNDQIALLRGMPGSTLSIEVLPRNAVVGSMPVRVALTRSRINNSQLTAALSVVNVKTETSTRRIGIISIPSFYLDFEARRRNEKDYVSVSRDVAQILEKVKQQNVEAVLIDLRNNGGGSLIEAVALSGLFVKGPIVQHRDRAAKVTLDSAPDGPFAWEGPVGVLINNASASASEIFAGAMQDYGRGIVIGENSFGMGTVQTMVDFDRSKTQAPQLGTLKLSITQFFRVNGSSTQLRGIIPDIALPAANETAVSRETDYESAIPWAEIAPASYTKVADLSTLIDGLAARHKRRATAQAKDKDKDKDKGTALADALQILGDQLNMEPKGAKK